MSDDAKKNRSLRAVKFENVKCSKVTKFDQSGPKILPARRKGKGTPESAVGMNLKFSTHFQGDSLGLRSVDFRQIFQIVRNFSGVHSGTTKYISGLFCSLFRALDLAYDR